MKSKIIGLALFVSLLSAAGVSAENGGKSSMGSNRAEAYVGGGCFWCVEAAFELLDGVINVESGYAGGSVPNPDYKLVCSGTTGHAEVVKITYDASKLNYRDILEWFFIIHDPTTLNLQGADVGTQYRSIILYGNEEEKRIALDLIRELNGKGEFDAVIVTEVVPLTAYWPAEEYHQDYYRKNPEAGYCRVVIAPKLKKLKDKSPR